MTDKKISLSLSMIEIKLRPRRQIDPIFFHLVQSDRNFPADNGWAGAIAQRVFGELLQADISYENGATVICFGRRETRQVVVLGRG